ncbi:MAG TPA: hypothetical protein VEP89_07690 [Draconibacterium sp.]|nr:hypothetical protein [Draconibacterium sp.]
MDLIEEHKGYFVVDRHFNSEEFKETGTQIGYNGVCKLFDAEQGVIFSDGQLIHIVRIFSEAIDLELLKCLSKEFSRL